MPSSALSPCFHECKLQHFLIQWNTHSCWDNNSARINIFVKKDAFFDILFGSSNPFMSNFYWGSTFLGASQVLFIVMIFCANWNHLNIKQIFLRNSVIFPLMKTDSIAQHIHMVKKCMIDWERACLYLKPYCSERKLKKALLIVCFNLEPYMLLNAHMSFERSIEFHWDLNLNFKILEIFASLGSPPQLGNSRNICYIPPGFKFWNLWVYLLWTLKNYNFN